MDIRILIESYTKKYIFIVSSFQFKFEVVNLVNKYF